MDWDILGRYQLGYVTSPMPGDERFTGTLSVPYLTQGGVKAIKFRYLSGDIKYGQHEGQKPRLYNPGAYFTAREAIGLCEGEIDAIVATERLGIPTMGIPGAEMWQPNASVWAPILKDFADVLVFADGDAPNDKTGHRPGEELAKRVAATVGWRAQIIYCPEGEDVASMVAAGNGEALTKQIRTRESG